MSLEIHPAGERYLTEAAGRSTWHSFSFGGHYDPANLGFAALVAHNDETLPPGTGYPDHPHSGLEIVTWVLTGALRHTDSAGTTGVLPAGAVQRISTGAGIVHSEVTEPGVRTRFLQAWLRSDDPGGAADYATASGVAGTGLTEVVGPDGLGLRAAGARLLVGVPDGDLALPDAPRLHVFVADGQMALGDRCLGPGDAARLTDQGGRSLTVLEPGPVAVWAFSS